MECRPKDPVQYVSIMTYSSDTMVLCEVEVQGYAGMGRDSFMLYIISMVQPVCSLQYPLLSD